MGTGTLGSSPSSLPLHLEPTMYFANTYAIRIATAADADALRRLAEIAEAPPLEGAVLVGELRGAPIAALALGDGRTVSDPYVPTAHLLATMRVRAEGVRAFERTPSLRERMLAGLPAGYRARPARRAA